MSFAQREGERVLAELPMRTTVVLHTRRGRGSTWRYLEDWGNGVERNVVSATYERFASVRAGLLATGRLPWGFGLRPRATIRFRRMRSLGRRPSIRLPGEERPERVKGGGITVVFTDLERVPAGSMAAILDLWDSLAASSHDIRVLNDPRTPKKRVPLLDLLSREGINDFAAYPIVDGTPPKPRKFPVFVREANDHNGPSTDLIHDQESLARWIEDARACGTLSQTPIVTEFVDTSDVDGRFRKYGAFRIGDTIVPAHVHVADSWAVKIRNSTPDSSLIEEEWDYIRTNRHEDQVMRVFRMARTEYGRMDYAMRDGRIQVFEINTSPTFLLPGTSKIEERTRRKEYVGRALHRAFVALGRST